MRTAGIAGRRLHRTAAAVVLVAAAIGVPASGAVHAAPLADVTEPAASGAAAVAAGTTKASVSLSGPSSAVYGSVVSLTGYARRTGTTTAIAGATILLQRTTHGGTAWTVIASAKTSSTGAFTVPVQLNTPYDYRVYYGGSATYTTAVSPRIYPIVRQNVLFDSIKDTDYELGTMQVGARIFPAPASGARIWLQRYNPSTNAWANFMSVVATGGTTFVIRGSVNGNLGTYRIYAPQHGYYAQSWSRQVAFAHYKWRGAYTKPLVSQGGTADWSFFISGEASKKTATLSADPGGQVYGVINTAGCTRYTEQMTNYADKAASVIAGPSTFSLNPNGSWSKDDVLNSTTFRLQVTDSAPSAQGPLLVTETRVLCYT